jgi:hypothetical protein
VPRHLILFAASFFASFHVLPISASSFSTVRRYVFLGLLCFSYLVDSILVLVELFHY